MTTHIQEKINPKTGKPFKRYCWTCGCCGHWGGDHPGIKAPGHKDEATFKNRMSGSNKNCLGNKRKKGGTDKSTYINKLMHVYQHYIFLTHRSVASKIFTTHTVAKADSGCTAHFIKSNHKYLLQNTNPLTDGPKASLPSKTVITASHEGILNFKNISHTAQKALVYPNLTNESLLSVG